MANTLPNSGEITMADMNTKFGRSSTRALGLDEARKMYNVANTSNLAFSDFYGKSATSSSLGGLMFHATLSTSACGCAIYEPGVASCPASPNGTQSNKRLYYYATDTLAVATQVFGDQLLTSSPTAGYYSDGTNYWQVDAVGNVIAIESCPTTTTTTTTTTAPPNNAQSFTVSSGTTGQNACDNYPATNAATAYHSTLTSLQNGQVYYQSDGVTFFAAGTGGTWSDGVSYGTFTKTTGVFTYGGACL